MIKKISRKKISLLFIFILPIFLLSSCNLIGNGSDSNLKKEFSIEAFKNPDVKYRPLPIIHTQVDKAMIMDIKDKGYGGVVNNVSFSNYLNSEEGWDIFEDTVEDVLNSGLRMWIYDERQYPSGSAGGQVLKDHSEWQARGLVSQTQVVTSGEIVKIQKPYKHDNPIFAYAYNGSAFSDIQHSDGKDLMNAIDKSGNLVWDAPDGNWFVIVLYPKNFYEGTHAASNWAEFRHSINLLNPLPVQKFIDLTYKKYYDRVGKYFGKGIEAFFTDEPSLMGTYFTSGPPTSPTVIDETDSAIPLIPAVNWVDNMSKIFKERRGYDMEPYLPYLYGGDSKEAKQFRWDYYKTTSELVTENYTGQIASYLDDKKVAMSGHLLLEEDIYMHPIFGGNYMQMYSKMQYPGIDLLTSYPQTAINWCVTTAKFASSTAKFYGREHVMSEVSSAFDNIPNDIYGKICSIAVQYAMGVNQINSFYNITDMDKEENLLFTNTIGRMGYMLDGGEFETNVAVYYPIEGIWTETLPPENLSKFAEKAVGISNNFKNLLRSFAGNQIDYDIFDDNNLLQCKVKDGSIITPLGVKFPVIVIPQTPALNSQVIEFLNKAAENGVKVIIDNSQSVLTERNANTESSSSYAALLKQASVTLTDGNDNTVKMVTAANVKTVLIDSNNQNVLAVKKNFKDSCVYMIVNASGQKAQYQLTMNEIGKKGIVRLWDPYTGEVTDETVQTDKDTNTTSLDLTLLTNRAVFITIE